MLVETMDRMGAAENAITPDRMMQGGRTVRRLPMPEYLKLGRASQAQVRPPAAGGWDREMVAGKGRTPVVEHGDGLPSAM